MSASTRRNGDRPVPENVAAVLVNHNGWRLTAACGRRLLADGLSPHRLMVVDNGSTDGSPERLARLLPRGRQRPRPANGGFAAGCNLGIAAAVDAGAEAVLLVNPDTVTLPGFVGRLVAGAGDLAGACASPEVFCLSEPRRAWFAGAWRGRWPGTIVRRPPGSSRCEVDYLWACCMLVGRQAWQRVGLFETAFFLFYEDMDWCERARRLGVRMRIVPAARLWHAVGRSSGSPGTVRRDAFRRYHMSRSAALYDRRWGHAPPGMSGWLRMAAAARTAVQLAVAGDQDALVAHVRGVRDGLRAHVDMPVLEGVAGSWSASRSS